MAESGRDVHDPVRVLDDGDPAEDDHAFYNIIPLTRAAHALIKYTEGDLVILFQGVYLVADLARMEIDLPVLFVVIMVDGQGVRIAVIPVYRKDTPRLIFQDLYAVLLGQLLFFSCQFSEHFTSPFPEL